MPLLSIHQCIDHCFEIISQYLSFVLFPTQKANATALKYKSDAEETHQGQQKIINKNNLLINAMKIQHKAKLTQQQKSHSEAVQLKNAQIRKFMDELSGMQQMFNELLDEVMDARQMVRITDKHRSKFRERAKALADELNFKKEEVNLLSDEVRDEQVLVTTLKRDIQDCNNTMELLQFTHEETVKEYEEQLNEAVEEIHVSTCRYNLSALTFSWIMFHSSLCSLRN